MSILNFNMDGFENLEIQNTCKSIIRNDGEKKYLPIASKKLWMRAKYPDAQIRYFTVESDAEHVLVEARVYASAEKPDSQYLGTGIGYAIKDKMDPENSLTELERRLMMIPTARGLAATRALTDAGFGLQFDGDEVTSDDPEKFMADEQAAEKLKPEIPEDKTPKKKSKEKDTTQKASAIINKQSAMEDVAEKTSEATEINDVNATEETTLSEAVADDITDATEETTLSEDVAGDITEVTEGTTLSEDVDSEDVADDIENDLSEVSNIEKIKGMPVPYGKGVGQTLGAMAEKFPLNIRWLYAHPDSTDEFKQDLLLLTKAYPKVHEIFRENNII